MRRQIASIESALGITDVIGYICVVDGEFPWFGSTFIGAIKVVSVERLMSEIRALRPELSAEAVENLSQRADRTLRNVLRESS